MNPLLLTLLAVAALAGCRHIINSNMTNYASGDSKNKVNGFWSQFLHLVGILILAGQLYLVYCTDFLTGIVAGAIMLLLIMYVAINNFVKQGLNMLSNRHQVCFLLLLLSAFGFLFLIIYGTLPSNT